MPTFEIGAEDFLLDGRPLRLVSGALHYFRTHPDAWADRLRTARLMGLNTVETYVPWNFHSPRRGELRLDGPADLGRFLDLAAAEGLHAVVRPGPFVCAEWDGGGLPAWLLAEAGVGVRRAEPRFLAAVEEHFSALLPVVAERQVTRGGNVVLVQVENEYGAYDEDADPADRQKYLEALVDVVRGAGIDVPLITCDQADDAMLERGGLPGLHRTATFGSRSRERLEVLRRHQPTGPLMCTEFWAGWFDTWGGHHHVPPAGTSAGDLDDLLAAGASVNIYMAHGGTNFGTTSGANHKGVYAPTTTSYDYGAPISEDGTPGPLFDAFRTVIARHEPVPAEVPAPRASAPTLDVALDHRLDVADATAALGPWRTWDHLPTADEVEQWTGLVLYAADVTAADRAVVLGEVRDHAVARLDRDPVAVLDRARGDRVVPLPARAGELQLLVEDMGRVNYGERIGEAKGLVGPARTAARGLTAWRTAALDLEDVTALTAQVRATPATAPDAPVVGPAFCAGTFDAAPGADHFFSVDGWGKGLVWVNGWCLGRYWGAGPARTLYVPGPLLRAEGNELLVLELHGAAAACGRLVDAPDLGHTEF